MKESVINHKESYGVFCMADRLTDLGLSNLNDGLDVVWEESIAEYNKFLKSRYNVDSKSELDCIDEYFNNL
jgi:hypothetical protein